MVSRIKMIKIIKMINIIKLVKIKDPAGPADVLSWHGYGNSTFRK